MMTMSIWLICGLLAICSGTNVPSQVLELNDKFLDVMNEGLWLVEFYAPWCGHCKRLAPIWEQVAHSLADANSEIRVGKVDCTRFTSVASALDVHGFPTIKFFRHGKQISYENERSKEALVDFALKTSGPEVRLISGGVDKFEKVMQQRSKKGFFLLVSDGEESKLRTEYHLAAKELFSVAYMYETTAENLPDTVAVSNTPAVIVFKDGISFEYDETMDGGNLLKWMQSERWPAFPLINQGNLYDIGLCCDKLLVLAVLDVSDRRKLTTSIGKFSALVERVAKENRDKLKDKYQFGWLDGNEMANGIILGTIPVPGILIFNVSSYQYYLSQDAPEQITKESLLHWLETPMGGRSIPQRIKRMAYELFTTIYSMFATQPLLTCCLFGLPLGFLAIICYSICSADFSVEHEEVYPDTEDEDTDLEDHEKVD